MGWISGAARDLTERQVARTNRPAGPSGQKVRPDFSPSAARYAINASSQASTPAFRHTCYGARGAMDRLPVSNGFSNLASGKPSVSSRRVRRAYRSSRVARRFLSPYRLSTLRSWRAISAQIVRRGVVGDPLRSATVSSDSWQDIDLEARQPLMEMTWSGAGRCSGAPPTGQI